jgi:ADP-heptose:LPS heptosyltransferase
VDNRTRSLEAFAPLAEITGVKFFSLQKGAEAAQPPPPNMQLIDLSSELRDFADTAAMIENLDLVISVDTSVAHLAGALGKPVWVLIPFQPDFRWMLDRIDTPWYPSMRLFRQAKASDWQTPIHRVAEALRAFPTKVSSRAVP